MMMILGPNQTCPNRSKIRNKIWGQNHPYWVGGQSHPLPDTKATRQHEKQGEGPALTLGWEPPPHPNN